MKNQQHQSYTISKKILTPEFKKDCILIQFKFIIPGLHPGPCDPDALSASGFFLFYIIGRNIFNF